MSTSTLAARNRIPAGVRAGGQFAPTPHGEPDLVLPNPAPSFESNGDRVARETREYATAKAFAHAAGVPLDYDRDGRPFAHYGALVVLGGNGEPVAAAMTVASLDRAVDDVLDADDEAAARDAVQALVPHLSAERFDATWSSLWEANTWARRFDADPSIATLDDPVGNSLVDPDEFRDWNGPDRAGENGYAGCDYGALASELTARWSDRRDRLVRQIAADEMAAART